MQMTEHYWLVNEMEPEMRNKAIAEYMPMDVLRWQGCVPDTDETPHENLDGDVGRSIGGDNGCPPFVFAHVPISWEEDFKGKGPHGVRRPQLPLAVRHPVPRRRQRGGGRALVP